MNQNNNSLNNIFKSGMFTSTPQKDTTSPFGTSNQNNTNIFGSQQPFGSSNIFQSNPLQGNAMGNTQNNPLMGNTTTSPFGQPTNQIESQSQGSGFGQGSFFSTPKPQGSVFGALGSTGTVQPLTSVTPQNNPSTGFTGSGWNTPSSNIFGSTPATSSYTSPSFSFQNSNSLSIGSLKNGTRDTPYQDTRIKDGIGTIEIKHINAMNEYTRKSNDELRHEDYNLGRKAITSGTMGGFSTGNNLTPSNNFNTTGSTNGLGSFGFNKVAPPQQTTTPFGSSFTPTPSFGTTSTPTPFTSSTPTSNPFGSQQPPQTPFQTSTQGSSLTSTQAPTQTPFTSASKALPTSNPFSFTSTSNQMNNNLNNSQVNNNLLNNQTSSSNQNQMTSQNPFSQQTSFPTTNMFGNTSSMPSSNNIPDNSTMMNSTMLNSTMMNSNMFNQNMPNQNMPNSMPNSTMFNTSSFQPQATSSHPVNYEDPFLLKDIKFEKVEKRSTPFSRVIPKPIFSESTKKPLINLKYRPPRVSQKKKIYTEPSIEEARHLKDIENLVVGFDGKGRIQYIDKICGSDITSTNIEDKITFMKNEVIVSDPPGIGLNKRARVYVEGVFAFSKSQGDFIVGKAEKFPFKAIQERFVYSLKEDPYKKFIDYNYDTGLYVYEVNHF